MRRGREGGREKGEGGRGGREGGRAGERERERGGRNVAPRWTKPCHYIMFTQFALSTSAGSGTQDTLKSSYLYLTKKKFGLCVQTFDKVQTFL